jgi:hypothetical protein
MGSFYRNWIKSRITSLYNRAIEIFKELDLKTFRVCIILPLLHHKSLDVTVMIHHSLVEQLAKYKVGEYAQKYSGY